MAGSGDTWGPNGLGWATWSVCLSLGGQEGPALLSLWGLLGLGHSWAQRLVCVQLEGLLRARSTWTLLEALGTKREEAGWQDVNRRHRAK